MNQPTVAILGASTDRTKYGNKSLRAHAAHGYRVFPVNPTGGEIEGLKAYRRLAEIPEPLNRISNYLPPQIGLQVLDEVAAKGCDEFWLNPGSESDELLEKARALDLKVVVGCSIVDLGVSPSDFPA